MKWCPPGTRTVEHHIQDSAASPHPAAVSMGQLTRPGCPRRNRELNEGFALKYENGVGVCGLVEDPLRERHGTWVRVAMSAKYETVGFPGGQA